MATLYRYAAFISYSSKDAAFAKRLHRALEAYRIPKSLGPFDVIGGGKPNRIYPVFRDREELAAGRLGEMIEANLTASSALIVVCSKDAASSPWVAKEIDYFLSLGRSDRIFTIIVENETASDVAACFPVPLKFSGADAARYEPLAADARREKDGFRNAYLKIVASIVGVSTGQLVDRDRTQRTRQTVSRGLFGAAALSALLSVSGTISEFSRRSLLSQTGGEGYAAGRQSFAALPPPDAILATTPDQKTIESLRRGLVTGLADELYIDGGVRGSSRWSDNGQELVLGGPLGGVIIWRPSTAVTKVFAPAPGCKDDIHTPFPECGSFALALSEKGLLATGDGRGRLVIYNTNGRVDGVFQAHDAIVSALEFSRDGKRLYAAGYDGSITAFDVASGAMLLDRQLAARANRLVAGRAGILVLPLGLLISETGQVRALPYTFSESGMLDLSPTSTNDPPIGQVINPRGLLLGLRAAPNKRYEIVNLETGSTTSAPSPPMLPVRNTAEIPHTASMLLFSNDEQTQLALDGYNRYIRRGGHWIDLYQHSLGDEVSTMSPDGRYVSGGNVDNQSQNYFAYPVTTLVQADGLLRNSENLSARLCSTPIVRSAFRRPYFVGLTRYGPDGPPSYAPLAIQEAWIQRRLPSLDRQICRRHGVLSWQGLMQIPEAFLGTMSWLSTREQGLNR